MPYVKSIDVCVQLESSGQWPDDLECIARLKAAFHVKIVDVLKRTYALPALSHIDHFDVLYKGSVFRFRICTSSELMLVRSRLTEQGVRVNVETPRSIAYERLMIDMPKLTAFVLALVLSFCTFETLIDVIVGPSRTQVSNNVTTRTLVFAASSSAGCPLIFCANTSKKRPWISSVPTYLLIRVLTSHQSRINPSSCTQLGSHPFTYRSIITGFVRFLELMANFDWKSQPLVIDPDREIKSLNLGEGNIQNESLF